MTDYNLLKSLACTALLSMGIVSAQTITFWHTYNQDSDENKTLLSISTSDFYLYSPQ